MMLIQLDEAQVQEALEYFVQNTLLNDAQKVSLIRITRVNKSKGATAELRVGGK